MTDVAWADGDRAYKLRAAGVCAVDGRLPVCSVEPVDGWFLPGGKVRFGESSAALLPPEIAPFLTGAARRTHLFVDRRRGGGS